MSTSDLSANGAHCISLGQRPRSGLSSLHRGLKDCSIRTAFYASVFSLCIVGCNFPKSEAIVPARKDVDAELRHKLECAKLKDNIQEGLEQDAIEFEALYSVFYSLKLNSCVAAKYTIYPKKGAPSSESLKLIDLLDQREVWGQYLSESKTYPEVNAMLDKQIEEIK